jgi:hypothetical protein
LLDRFRHSNCFDSRPIELFINSTVA